jgi:hypothetical protein
LVEGGSAVLRIGTRAFADCVSLKEFALGPVLEQVGWEAFSAKCKTALTLAEENGFFTLQNGSLIETQTKTLLLGNPEAPIPKDILHIAPYAYEECLDIKTITFPDGLKSVGAYAFKGCKGIKEVSFPDGFSYLGYQAFCDLPQLTKVTFGTGRRTVKEKRCGGTLASPLPWREILPDEMTFADAIRQLGESQAFLFRHCDVPFTNIRQMERDRYGYSLMQTGNSMMFSYLPSGENGFGGRSYQFSAYNFCYYVMPLYVLTMQEASSGRFVFSYIHRLLLTKDDDVYRFHDGVVRTILKGVMNPGKTIGEIMEEI